MKIKSLNMMFLSLLLWSMLPVGADAAYQDNDRGIEVDMAQEGGYFQSVVTENKQVEIVSIQDIKKNIGVRKDEAIVEGEYVYVSTDKGDIIAYPHTLKASGWVYVDYRSRYSGEVEISFGFNGVDQVQMVKGEKYKRNWEPLDSVRTEERELAGANLWNSVPQDYINKDIWYSARFWVEIPFSGLNKVEGKYNIAVKPVGADLSEAVILDPWYGVGWPYAKQLTLLGPWYLNPSVTSYQKMIRVYKTVSNDTTENIARCPSNAAEFGVRPYGTNWAAQTFTAEITGTVRKVYIAGHRTGVPAGTYAIAIRTVNATGYPTGANLCSANMSFATVDTATYAYYQVDMGVGTNVTAGTKYAIVVYGSDANITDYIWMGGSLGNYYTGGTECYSTDAGATWSETGNRDYGFQVATDVNGTIPLAIGCGGHVNNDFSDLRFTSSDGTTLIPYWIENYVSGSYADVWIKMPVSWAGTATTAYMYYGNTGATSVGSIDNTMVLADDFGDASYNATKWQTITGGAGGTATEAGGVLTLTTAGTLTTDLVEVFSQNAYQYSSDNSPNYAAYGLIRNTPAIVGGIGIGFSNSSYAAAYSAFAYRQTSTYFTGRSSNDVTSDNPSYTIAADTAWHRVALFRAYHTNDRMFMGTENIYGNYYSTASRNAMVAFASGNGTLAGTVEVDYYFVTYTSDNEPLWGTIGSEISDLPLVTTLASTGTGNNWIQLNGLATVGAYGNPIALYGFDYGATTSYGANVSTTTALGTGVFSSTISGLTPATSYHYRAWAINTAGILMYGADMTASTLGAAILYENYMSGCNTTWSQAYERYLTMGVNWSSVYGNNWVGQNFTVTSSHSVNQVKIWARRTATAPDGYVYVGIRDCTSSTPTEPDLGIGLYANAYVSTTGGPIEVSLENEVQLISGREYAIVIRDPAADNTNYVDIMYNIGGGYVNGQRMTSSDGGAAWTGSATDINFEIIGKPQPIYANVMAGQSFTTTTLAHTALKIRLILGRVGQPGNVYVSLRSHTGGVMSANDLAIVALNGNAITLDKASYDCILVPEKSLEANKEYAIIVFAPSGDRYNYIQWCGDSTGGYSSGNATISVNAGVSWSSQVYDYNFEIWGNPCLSVLNAKIFKNYITTNDWLITTEVLNVYPPYYDNNDDPSTLFKVSFMSQTGTEYGATPCNLWGKNPISIYMNPTQASSLTWGGNYKIRISKIDGTDYAEYGLQGVDWVATNLIYLDNWVRSVAKDMEIYETAQTGTSTSYLTYAADKGSVLNTDGGAIFTQAIPRISYVRPNLFLVTTNEPDMVVITPPPASGDYHIILGSYLSGLIDQGATAMGISDAKSAGGIMIVTAYAIIAFGTVIKGFAWAGMIAALPVIFMGMYYELLSWQLILVIILILVVLFAREFWLKGG